MWRSNLLHFWFMGWDHPSFFVERERGEERRYFLMCQLWGSVSGPLLDII
jgi:hypothetical protein